MELASTGEQFPMWYVSSTQINAQMLLRMHRAGPVQVRVRTANGVKHYRHHHGECERAAHLYSGLFGAGLRSGHQHGLPNDQRRQSGESGRHHRSVDEQPRYDLRQSGSGSARARSHTRVGSSGDCSSGVTASINGISSPVTFAGLSPGSSGLYQVNVQAPFITVTGPVSVQITAGGVTIASR